MDVLTKISNAFWNEDVSVFTSVIKKMWCEIFTVIELIESPRMTNISSDEMRVIKLRKTLYCLLKILFGEFQAKDFWKHNFASWKKRKVNWYFRFLGLASAKYHMERYWAWKSRWCYLRRQPRSSMADSYVICDLSYQISCWKVRQWLWLLHLLKLSALFVTFFVMSEPKWATIISKGH